MICEACKHDSKTNEYIHIYSFKGEFYFCSLECLIEYLHDTDIDIGINCDILGSIYSEEDIENLLEEKIESKITKGDLGYCDDCGITSDLNDRIDDLNLDLKNAREVIKERENTIKHLEMELKICKNK